MEVARLTVIRIKAGVQVNLTGFIHLGIEYKYNYYRLNKEATIARMEIYGPCFFGAVSF
jgi:hypothetical protein